MTAKRIERTPPANVAAEKAILGAVMLDNDLFTATTPLDPEDFSLESHRLIYSHISEMMARGEAVDLVTLAEDMGATNDLESIGSTPVAYLSDLSADTIRYRQSVRDWVRIVKAKSLLRQLIGACNSAIEKVYAGEQGSTIIQSLRESIDEIESTAKRGMRSV